MWLVVRSSGYRQLLGDGMWQTDAIGGDVKVMDLETVCNMCVSRLRFDVSSRVQCDYLRLFIFWYYSI